MTVLTGIVKGMSKIGASKAVFRLDCNLAFYIDLCSSTWPRRSLLAVDRIYVANSAIEHLHHQS